MLHQVVIGGRSLDTALSNEHVRERDRPLIRELTIGSVRHYFSLSDEVSSRLIAPLKPRDSIVHCLLIIGAYQLRHTRIPHYAAVSETVAATRQIGRPWARGLANQVLRGLATSPALSPSNDEAHWDHPGWLIDLIREDYPQTWEAILQASLSRAPLTLRVNLQRTSRAQYLELLNAQGVSAHTAMPEEALVLDAPTSVRNLPGFDDGTISVQDEGAQHAAELLAPTAGDEVLDACAAPGGKAMHLLERVPEIRLVALDRDADRCELVRNECRRHGVDPKLVTEGDATNLQWWDGRLFDRILLDAPCSGTGTLRRHPDIKLLKRALDIPQYHQTQSRLLANLWRTLAPGGRLLYCTCSILSAENDGVVREFLAMTSDAVAETIATDWGLPTRHGRQLLPSIGGADGFYYAILLKR
jgi:16S rRNA (cytosine967-C5)-methyltransferase